MRGLSMTARSASSSLQQYDAKPLSPRPSRIPSALRLVALRTLSFACSLDNAEPGVSRVRLAARLAAQDLHGDAPPVPYDRMLRGRHSRHVVRSAAEPCSFPDLDLR